MCPILSFCGDVMVIFILWRWRQHLDLYGRQVLLCLPLHQTKRMCRRRPVHPHDQHLLLWGLFFRAPTNLLASGLLPLAGCWEGKTQAGHSHGIFFKDYDLRMLIGDLMSLKPKACALVYLLMAIWLSMHASIKSHSYATRLLTRWGWFGWEEKMPSLFFLNGYQCYQHPIFLK